MDKIKSVDELMTHAIAHPTLADRRWKLTISAGEDYRLITASRAVLILAPEFGKQVQTTWKTKKSRYTSREEPVGSVTLIGILTRLGEKDAAQKVRDALYESQTEARKNHRNSIRRSITNRLNEIEALVNSSGKEVGITVDMFQLPVELAEKLELES